MKVDEEIRDEEGIKPEKLQDEDCCNF